AVALFVDRARAADPTFALDAANAPAVARLCHRLDGLPLAIELAAGRTGALPPAALLARWEAATAGATTTGATTTGAAAGGLALLAGGRRDLPARQQTLRAAIAWSHDLLSNEEQTIFRRLGVFEGGISLEAAEAVCGLDPEVVLEGVTSLAARSLVQRVGEGVEARFAMLETIGGYALERLNAAGEAEEVRCRHAAYFVDLAERAERALFDPERCGWLERMSGENDNLRAALRWLVEREEAEPAQRLVTALAQLWPPLGLVAEGRTWAERLAARPDPPTPARARFLANAYLFHFYQGDLARASAWAAEGLAAARTVGEPRALADALFAAGYLAQIAGRPAEAIPLVEESLEHYRAVGAEGRRGMALMVLGLSRAVGDPGAADAALEQAVDLYQRLDSWFGRSLTYVALGRAAVLRGDAAAACAFHLASLRLSREHGDRWTATFALSSMMPALAELGDLETALPLVEELLALAGDLALHGYARSALSSLERLAPSGAAAGPAAALYARYADLLAPAAGGQAARKASAE
ncbi:MAG TPA: hypothetical protein VFN74_24950, partial [Chloroflexota bacterium]|nr:hypothetical protein [Chloroflexota bacterium]